MVIVRCLKNNKKYIYLGAGYGHYKYLREGVPGGYIFPKEYEGRSEYVVVSNEKGNLFWIPSVDIQVLSIDGKTPEEIYEMISEE